MRLIYPLPYNFRINSIKNLWIEKWNKNCVVAYYNFFFSFFCCSPPRFFVWLCLFLSLIFFCFLFEPLCLLSLCWHGFLFIVYCVACLVPSRYCLLVVLSLFSLFCNLSDTITYYLTYYLANHLAYYLAYYLRDYLEDYKDGLVG